MKRHQPTIPPRQQGVALLEALIAAIILAIGLLGAVGLQARSYAAISEAGLRAEAMLAADELLGIMSNDRVNLAGYQIEDEDGSAPAPTPPASLAAWAEATGKRIPGARFSVDITPGVGQAQIDIDIRWKRREGDAENRHQVTSYILNLPAAPVVPPTP